MQQLLDHPEMSAAPTMPRVRRVDHGRPWVWLRRGAGDLARTPGPSLGMGALIAAVGLLLTGAGWKASYLAPALLGGFLLVAPIFAVVLYGLARQLEQDGRADLGRAARAWLGNAGSITLFGLMLTLSYIVWERLAAIVFALFYEGQALQLSRWPAELLLSRQYDGLLLAFMLVGGALALIVFALSVVSAPLLVDRPVDAITAALTSLRCCRLNPAAMLLWALLIAALTAIGFATLMLGLVVVFPWLAHASWHAYRDLVEPD